MSAHLMIVAGYMDLPLSHKLTLMKLCDSADDRTRIAFPGLDAVRLWAGTKRSRSLDVLKELQEAGLLMQVSQGHRGRRAEFKVFPEPGDEVFSLAHKQKKLCPGAERFKGSPGIPTDVEVAERIAEADSSPSEQPASFAKANAKRKGPASRTQSEGSNLPDPSSKGSTGSGASDPLGGERVQSRGGKGPADEPVGSGAPDPFGTYLPTTNFQNPRADSLRSSDADASHDDGTLIPDPRPAAEPARQKPKAIKATKAERDAAEVQLTADADEVAAWWWDAVVKKFGPCTLGGRPYMRLRTNVIKPALKAGLTKRQVAQALQKCEKHVPLPQEWQRACAEVGGYQVPSSGQPKRQRIHRQETTGLAEKPAAEVDTSSMSDEELEAHYAGIFGAPAEAQA